MTDNDNDEPMRVWIGCLACYNAGRLVGEWVDAIDAEDMTPAELHAGRLAELEARDGGSPHEEMWCMDTEYMPVSGEMSPMDATAWARAVEEIPDYIPRAAVRAFISCRGEHYVDRDTLADDFQDAYRGEWDSFREYAENFADDIGLLKDVDDEISQYFDWDAWASNMEHDYSVEEAPGYRVFIFDAN